MASGPRVPRRANAPALLRSPGSDETASVSNVMTLVGEDELAARAGHLFGDVRSEFICAATDIRTWSHPQRRVAVAGRLRPAMEAGLAVRKLYTGAALADDAQRRELIAIAAMGASVRISAAGLPHETIIIDRRAMILAGETVRGDRQFTVTTSPTLISGVLALFQAAWESAATLGSRLNGDLAPIDAAYRPILQALGAGLTDEAAARRVGMSLRTYRRRVAELMKLLDSGSRFQAGVRAGELGLT
jgi:DNA-binding NarL/FixJ family response regulator